MEGVLEGLRFVGRTQILLGAILLDLLAVLFGGAVALLPVFAKSICTSGRPAWACSAPHPRSARCSARPTSPPPDPRPRRTHLLIAVGLYGVSMIVFGLLRVFVISLLALIASGFVDLYSMNIRATMVALATRTACAARQRCRNGVHQRLQSTRRVRVRSGRVLVGTVPAVVGGGVITILLALTWGRLFRRPPTSIGSRTFDQPSRNGRLPA